MDAIINDRFARIEAELRKASAASISELRERVDAISDNAGDTPSEIGNRLAALQGNLEDPESSIAWQIECVRRIQQIHEGLRELRTNAGTARLRDDGESTEQTQRSTVVKLLGWLQRDFDSFVLPFWDGKNLSVLAMRLEEIQKALRQTMLASPPLSIEQIDSEVRSIQEQLDDINQWAKNVEEAETARATGKAEESLE